MVSKLYWTLKRLNPTNALVIGWLLVSSNVGHCQNNNTNQTIEKTSQFDFWIGTWDVFTASGQKAGSNTIEPILGGRVLHESWTGARGTKGFSYNIFNNGRWHQSWVDNRGSLLLLDGEFRDGKMVMRSSPSKPGDPIDRISWETLTDGRVKQHWQKSTDGGNTWQDAFVGFYVRREANKESEHKNVLAVQKKYAAGWSNDDPELVMSVFAEEAVLIPHHGHSPLVGKNAIRDFFWPKQGPKTSTNSFEEEYDEVRIDGKLGYIRGRFKLSFTIQESEGNQDQSRQNQGNFLVVLRKIDNQWKVVQRIWN